MLLQNVVIPRDMTDKKPLLYVRSDGNTAPIGGTVTFAKDATASFDTYFGAFSVGKWSRYADLKTLFLRVVTHGAFSLNVIHRAYAGTLPDENEIVLFSGVVDGETRIALPGTNDGLYYFTLTAKEEGALLAASYETDDEPAHDVNLCGVICTYRREPFVTANVAQLKRDVLDNPDSPLQKKLTILIADNGCSLPETLNGSGVTVFPNKNAGGAGGFTRGLMEMLARREKEGYTHVVMMDDDIRFETESFLRVFSLLSYLREEHADGWIGGAMFRTDKQHIQNEMADYWDYETGKVVPVHPSFDMTRSANLLKNEREEEINYLSWWFCVLPASVPQEDNLPLPVFIKRDDIEYGLRNGKDFLTLNGIGVWHEPFEAKRPASLEYYYTRNRLIMESVLDKNFTRKEYQKQFFKEIVKSVLAFRYNEAMAVIRGADDFMNGVDALLTTDPTALNREIMGYNAKPALVREYKLDVRQYNAAKRWSIVKKILATCTINGWLLPAFKTVVVPSVRPNYKAFFGAKRAINLDANGVGYATERSYREAWRVWKCFGALKKRMKKELASTTEEFRARKGELTSIATWKRYEAIPDGIVKTVPDPFAYVEEARKKRKERKQRSRLFLDAWVRFALRIAAIFTPLKKNRVIFVAVARRGYADNLKYVSEKLRERFGDRYSITWATEHPDTCDEIRKKGINVLEMSTCRYMLEQLRCKTVVYNDAIPSYMIKRKGQIYLNTWHGGINYKHIGYKYLVDQSAPALRRFRLRNPQPDYYLSGSEFFTENTSQSFGFDPDVFLPWGLPRNDVLFETEKHAAIVEKVRAFYHIPAGKKILLYAPTFRIGFASEMHDFDYRKVCDALSRRFGGEFVTLYRGHSFVRGAKMQGTDLIDATAYHDMQELLVASDVLVSDYSSVMWDFTFLRRPVFVYAPDMQNYRDNERDFAFTPDRWPYPIAEDNAQLEEKILAFDEEAFGKKCEAHHEDAGSYENADTCKKVAELIDGICFPQ